MSKLTKVFIYEIIISVIIIAASYLFTSKTENKTQFYDGTWFTYSANEKIIVNPNETVSGVAADETLTIKTILPTTIEDGNSLAFFTVHQKISVYVGDKVIYSFDKLPGEIGKTPGNNWNFVSIPSTLAGSVLTINLTSEYDATSGKVPKFYYGDEYNLLRGIFGVNIIFCFVSMLMMVTGVVVLICWLFMRKRVKINNSLFYLALFSITGAIWSAVESYIPILIFGHNSLMSCIGFLMLMLMPYPFMKFVTSVYNMKKFMAGRIFRVIALLNFIVQNVLCYLKIFDYREMVSASHLIIGAGGIIIALMTIMKVFCKDDSGERPYAHILAVTLLAVCFLLEIARYYFGSLFDSSDAALYIRIGLLIYIIILGGDSLKQISTLIKSSQKAEKLEKVAYTDPLTGLGNRTAYLKLANEIPECMLPSYSVIGLDINNLKHINDTYGHSSGDRYIIFCAGVISRTIGDLGSIFRMGGDEFCVIIKDPDSVKLDEIFIEMQRLVNEKKNEFDGNIGIAHGVAAFDLHSDKSLNDTLNRADGRMYENKKVMKSLITT